MVQPQSDVTDFRDSEMKQSMSGTSKEESEDIEKTQHDKHTSNMLTATGKDVETGEQANRDDVPSGGSQEDDGLPIDRGWAWLVLAGSFLNVILVVGYTRSIGVLFVEYLKVFEASATKTTLFMGVMAAVFSISSLVSMNLLLQLIGERKTVLLGGAISALAMLTAVFATSITFLICTHSILIGIGHSMIHGPGLVMIGQYFKKRRGLATAVSMSGISLGGSIFPPLIRVSVDEYGVRGTMLLLTGLTMNMWVGGMLYRPLESFRKHSTKGINVLSETKTTDITAQKDSGDNDLNPDEEMKSPLILSNTGDETNTINSETNLRKRVRTLSDNSQYSNSDITSIRQLEMYTSQPELTSMSMLDLTSKADTSSENHKSKRSKSVCGYLRMAVASFDFSLFKHPIFQVIVVTSSFAVIFMLVAVYLPALAKEKGIPPTKASLLLTIYSSIDFFARLAVGFIADRKILRVTHLMAIGVFLAGTATHFASFYNSYALMILYSVLIGLFGSFYNCLLPVGIIESMGQKNMAKVLGFVALFHGLSLSLTHPIMGFLRDLTGSYNTCYNYIGACNYMAVCFVSPWQ